MESKPSHDHENSQLSYRFEWQTPLGPMRGEVSARGLRSLHFPGAAQLIVAPPAGAAPPSILTSVLTSGDDTLRSSPEFLAVARISEATRQFLELYFQGHDAGEAPPLDWAAVPPFDRAVWEAAREIGLGSTRSYGELAATLGRPKAARAVGGALGRNRFVLIVPCHRVLARDGKLGGFTGGLALKAWLLEHESLHASVLAS